MRHLILALVCQSALLFSDHTLLKNFYNLLRDDNNLILKMEINFFQNQYGNTFNSSGAFYVVSNKEYLYDSPQIKIIVKDTLITSINNETKQLVYSYAEKEHLNILGILSGNLYGIELQENTDKYSAHFKVLDLDYEGTFQFDKNSGLLKMVTLTVDENQNFAIEVKSVDLIMDNGIQNIDHNNFEIIDLRD